LTATNSCFGRRGLLEGRGAAAPRWWTRPSPDLTHLRHFAWRVRARHARRIAALGAQRRECGAMAGEGDRRLPAVFGKQPAPAKEAACALPSCACGPKKTFASAGSFSIILLGGARHLTEMAPDARPYGIFELGAHHEPSAGEISFLLGCCGPRHGRGHHGRVEPASFLGFLPSLPRHSSECGRPEIIFGLENGRYRGANPG